MVSGKVNGGGQEFLLDTGAERTVISLDVARRRGVQPITSMQTAGVGEVGLRGLEVGRIDTLEIGGLQRSQRAVPDQESAPRRAADARARELLAFGARPVDAYRLSEAQADACARTIEPETYTNELPLRMHRLALVRGTINGALPATFVVDTGGELISISDATAGQIQPASHVSPHSAARLWHIGLGQGRVPDAGRRSRVQHHAVSRIPVVVLNLRAPSALLGFQARRYRRPPIPEQVPRDDRHGPQRRRAGCQLKPRTRRAAEHTARPAAENTDNTDQCLLSFCGAVLPRTRTDIRTSESHSEL